MEIKIKHVLLTAAAIVGGYQLYKHATKPPVTSSASGYAQNTIIDGKVYTKTNGAWKENIVQPSPMSWYILNGKYHWVKWNGEFAN